MNSAFLSKYQDLEDIQIFHKVDLQIKDEGNNHLTKLNLIKSITEIYSHIPPNYYIPWMQYCVRVSKEYPSDSFKLLDTLLKRYSKLSQSAGEVTSTIITKFLKDFSINSTDNEAAVKCLTTCMSQYSGTCSQYKETISNFLSEKLLGDKELSPVIAECTAQFPSIHSTLVQGSNSSERWKSLYSTLLNSCEYILDMLFTNINVPQNQVCGENVKLFTGLQSSFSFDNSRDVLKQAYKNFVSVLCKMLTNGFPSIKPIPLQETISLCCRVFNLTQYTLDKKELHKLNSIMLQLHCTTLPLLDYLIKLCTTHLYPFCTVINDLIKQTLMLSVNTNLSSRVQTQVRLLTYNTLCVWLLSMRSASCFEDNIDDVVKIIMCDIDLQRSSLPLLVQQKKKKKKGQLQQANNVGNDEVKQFTNPLDRENLCYLALKTTQLLLQTCGLFMSKTTHQSLQQTVVTVLQAVQQYTSSSECPGSYSRRECGEQLYKTLLYLITETKPSYQSSLAVCVGLFQAGQSDSSAKVSRICHDGLSVVERLLHPGFQPYSVTVEAEPVQKRSLLDRFREEQSKESAEVSVTEEVSDEVEEAEVDQVSDDVQQREENEIQGEETGVVEEESEKLTQEVASEKLTQEVISEKPAQEVTSEPTNEATTETVNEPTLATNDDATDVIEVPVTKTNSPARKKRKTPDVVEFVDLQDDELPSKKSKPGLDLNTELFDVDCEVESVLSDTAVSDTSDIIEYSTV